jgi:ATP/maltotriose-dependent transcriptional regulator MalT
MKAKTGESTAEFEVTSGITLSRTLIPTLPPNFLSRKHLFPLLENPSPSTTVVLAPAGYGKTSLVAEWAQSQRDRVIWVTLAESDTLEEMSAIFIQATRNILPGFAPWFDQEPGIRPVENVRRWGNELLALGKDFILVIDNLRQHTARDVDIAVKLNQQFPPNLQFVTIRRDSIETVYATFSSRGPLTIVGMNDLAFSPEEVRALADFQKVSLESPEILASISAAHGWPAATAMLLQHISKDNQAIDFENIISAQSDPLRALVVSVLNEVDSKLRSMLVSLSIVEEFSHLEAEVILADAYDFDLINQAAIEGRFFMQIPGVEKRFAFSALVREVLLVELRKDKNRKIGIHSALLSFYEFRNESNLALEHAYLAGNLEKVSELFPSAARILQATGQGRELIRWALFAGDASQLGLLKRGTVELAGHVASLDYHSLSNTAEYLRSSSKGTVLEGFIKQITHAALAHVDLAFGRFETFNENFQIAMKPQDGPIMLGIDEQVGLLRLAAMVSFILDEGEKIEAIESEARALISTPGLSLAHYHLTGIRAMSLLLAGEYRNAYEIAQQQYSQALLKGFTGFFGPLESLSVMARCQWEFGNSREALHLYTQLRDLSEEWKQWHWYFVADGFLARDMAVQGLITEALDKVSCERKKASQLASSDSLNTLIDLTELFVRYELNDFERVIPLLKRAPSSNLVRQIQLSVDEKLGKKTTRDDAKNLPYRTPREKIWKHLADVDAVLDQEQLAMKEMKKALEVGATVGAKETFLRQSQEMGNLIMKIAGDNPTVYLEDLATSVANRIKNNQNRTNDLASALTKRELEVLRHLSTERPISAIAGSLHISLNTMKTHLKNLYRKMEVDGRVSAVEKAKANFIL